MLLRINTHKHLYMKSLLLTVTVFSILLNVSCQHQGEQMDQIALNDTTSVYGFTGENMKLVKTAGLNFKVHDIEESVRKVSALAQSFGGMVFNQQLDFNEINHKELRMSADSLLVITAFMPEANIMVRIPSVNLDSFIYSATATGYFTRSTTLEINDESIRYLENKMKRENRQEALSSAVVLNDKISYINKAVKLKDEAIGQEMSNRILDADVKFSTVRLHLIQNALIKKEVVANSSLEHFQLSFSSRFSNAFHSGWSYFINFLLTIVHLWMFIILAILGYFLVRVIQQRSKFNGVNLKPVK